MNNYGFIEKNIKIKPEDFLFGALSQKVIRPNGDWEDALPEYESQARKYETFGCTVWGSQNQVEAYLKGVFGVVANFLERFNYNIIGIEPPGANPNDAYQSMRPNHGGLIQEGLEPMPDTIEEFKTPRPMTQELLDKGEKWGYILQHEWIQSGDMKSAIIEALKYSPVACSVTAWYKEGDFYVDNGEQNGHWVLCYGWGTTPEGKTYLKIFDSYDLNEKEFKRNLHPNHRVGFAKRILLTPKPETVKEVKISLIKKILGLMYQLLEELKKKYGQVVGRFA